MSRTITLVGYVAILAASIGYEAVGRVRRRVPTLVDALRAAWGHPVLRWVLLVGWMWVGWHVFVRSHH